VYAAALENGQTPCDYLENKLQTYADWENWRPENSENSYGGFYSMKGALTKSLNTISVQLFMRAGMDNVINLANRMGISSDMPHKPAIALGAADITLREMVTAYATLAAMGVRHNPVYLLRIEDRAGKVLKTFEQPNPEGERVLADSLARFTVEMMRGVVDNGTGARLRSMFGLRNDIAGKTGTTQNQTDGWFIGFTPNIVAGVWVGGDDPAVRFKSLALGQGANTSLPIFGTFLQKVYADGSLTNYRPGAAFPVMSDTLSIFMDCPDFTEDPDSLHRLQNEPPENIPVNDPKNDNKDDANKEKIDALKPKGT
jgi:penicillin-binding protein 1A